MTHGENSGRVLVTGGAGFIGSHLTERLGLEGYTVEVLDDLSSGWEENLSKDKIRLTKGDIRNVDLVDTLVKHSEMVFHLAEFIPDTERYGAGHVIRYSVENPLLDFDISCRGTLILLEKCRQYDKKLIFTSTSAVYGSQDHALIGEDFRTMPTSPYGASKLCAETYATLYSRLYGLRTSVLRLFNAFGPRQRKYVVYDTLLKLRRDPQNLEVLGTGQETRDFVYVDDVVDALLLVANSNNTRGRIFNVGTGIGTKIMDLVEMITSILGVSPKVKYSCESWKGDINTLVADTGRIRGLGFAPKYSVEDGMKESIKWFNGEVGR